MRSVVRGSTARCPRCRLTTRWCVCAAQREVCCPSRSMSGDAPSRILPATSTGHLIRRVIPDVRIWRRERRLTAVRARAELWIVHPQKPTPPGWHREAMRWCWIVWGGLAMVQEMMPWAGG